MSELNWLDRAIAALAPRYGLQRAMAREALAEVRAYDGAKTGRRTDGWIALGSSGNAEAGPALDRLRNRGRDLERNNFWGKRAVSIWGAYLVGSGIVPKIEDDGARQLFDAWAEDCDADGETDLYGLQARIARHAKRDGEVLVRRRWRRPGDGLDVPMQLQLLEADYLDTAKTQALDGGGFIVQGVEFDAIGRRQAYWLFDQHPGDSLPGLSRNFVSRRIPASEIQHIKYSDRVGQVRGASRFACVLIALRDYGDLQDFELVRRKVEASVSAFVLRANGSTSPLAASKTDAEGKRVETMRPGMVVYLPQGDDVKFNAPSGSGGFRDVATMNGQNIAVGLDIPYELLTGDLSNVNYSSMRGGMLPFKRLVEQDQLHVLVPQHCRATWRWFVEATQLTRRPVDAALRPEWQGPKFEYVDPLKDVLADVASVRAGFDPFDAIAAQHGWTVKELVDKLKTFNQLLDDAGAVLTVDPRRVSDSGNAHTQAILAQDAGGLAKK